MLIFQRQYVTITIINDLNAVHQKWRGFCTIQEFTEAIDISFEALSRCRLSNIISDVSEQRVVAPAGQDYVRKKVNNFIADNYPILVAFILRKKSIVRKCVQRYIRKTETGFNFTVNDCFFSFEDAAEWLRSQKLPTE